MPRYVRHYDFDPASEWIDCGECGWKGVASQASIELFAALCELECPTCGHRLIVIPYPSHDETRAAAAGGNERAQLELVSVDQVEARWKKAAAVALTRPSQLPEVKGPVDVVWDFVTANDERLTILRASDQIL